jgi:hypothetical protein
VRVPIRWMVSRAQERADRVQVTRSHHARALASIFACVLLRCEQHLTNMGMLLMSCKSEKKVDVKEGGAEDEVEVWQEMTSHLTAHSR